MKLFGNTFMVNEGEKAAQEYALLCEPTFDQNVIHTHMYTYA